jgi:hypothetical protein
MPNLSLTCVPFSSGNFSPSSISGCKLWLDGADLTSLFQNTAGSTPVTTTGQVVQLWKDKSGTGNNASSSSSSMTYGTSNVNFPGSQTTGLSLSPTLLPTGTTDSTWFFLINTTSTGVMVFFAQGGGADLKQFYLAGNNLQSDKSGVGGISGSTAVNTGANIIFSCLQKNSATAELTGWQNGNQFATMSYSFNVGTPTAATIGTDLGSYAYTGYIAEIIVYNSSLSITDRQNVEGYLAQKWSATGLPTGHPGLSQTLFSATPALRSLGGLTSTLIITSIPYYTTFNPINLGNLALWLDASQDTTANGVSIASLIDRSGNGNSLTPSGTISAATNFLQGRTVYNFGSSRASKTNFPWQTSFTQIVLVKCATGNWLSSLVSGGAYLSYIFAGNYNLINVNNFFNPLDSVAAQGTSVFTYAADGVSSWVILSLGYQSGATSASNYTINGTVRTTATSTAVSSAISGTNQLWLNGNGSFSFDTGTYVAEMMHYNAVLTNTQRQQVESYLAQKWGLLPVLPVGHLQDTAPAGMPTSVLTKSLTNNDK